jgi:hypothetical protein
MHDGCKLQFDAHILTIVFEFLGCEVHPIVRDDTMWNPKAKYYRLDEIDRRCGILSNYWGYLNPLGELIDCYQHVDVPAWP